MRTASSQVEVPCSQNHFARGRFGQGLQHYLQDQGSAGPVPALCRSAGGEAGRQSGFLIPTIGTSNSKGTIVGDSFYWAINRSMDATLGAEYLSRPGWLLHET